MASSGTITSWKTTGSYDFGDGNGTRSYAGAHYSFEWTSEKLSTPGQTKVTYNLYRRGRTSSPTKLTNYCKMVVTDSNGVVHRNLDTGQLNSSPGVQFNNSLHETGSFTVNHASNGSASFTVAFSFYAVIFSFHDTTETATLDTNIPSYTITYDANGGTNAPSATKVTPGSSFYLPNSSTSPQAPTGYHPESRWNTSADESGSSYAYGASYKPTSSRTLYAEWDPNTYTIAYNGNGSTSGSTSSQSATYNSNITLRTNGFTRAYTVSFNSNGGSSVSSQTTTYTFGRWNTNSSGTGSDYNAGQSVKNLTSTNGGTVTLYAEWDNPQTIHKLPVPTRSGYLFKGWSTSSSATTGSYAGGSDYIPTSSHTLYAVWQKIEGYDDNIVYIKSGNVWYLARH